MSDDLHAELAMHGRDAADMIHNKGALENWPPEVWIAVIEGFATEVVERIPIAVKAAGGDDDAAYACTNTILEALDERLCSRVVRTTDGGAA